MNLRAAMLAPWRASTRSERVLAVTLFVLAAAIAVGMAVSMREPDSSRVTAMMISIAVGPLWLMVMPKALTLAIDARELRLPAAQREIVAGLGLYGALCVVLPTLILGFLVGSPAQTAAMLALVCSGCFAVALLPAYQFVALVAAFFVATSGKVSFGFGAADFPYWAWPLVVVFVALAVLNWRTALRRGQRRLPHWREPLGIRALGQSEAKIRLGRQLKVDVRGCGPAAPIRSVRVALGDIHAPRPSRVLATALLAATVSVLVLIFVAVALGTGLGTAIWSLRRLPAENPLLFAWVMMVFGFASVWIIGTRLQQRWNRGTERGLLALLPGLHGERPARCNVLYAALLVPGSFVLALNSIALAVAGRQASVATCVVLVLASVAMVCELVAFTLAALPGRLERWRWLVLGTLVMPLLLSISFAIATADRSITWRDPFMLLVVGAWLLLIACLVWAGCRAWRAFESRPNPFVSA